MSANVSTVPPAGSRPQLALVQSESRLPETNDALERLLSEEDGRGLRQYFGGGFGRFQRSSMGRLLDAMGYRYTWPTCWKCRGTGFSSSTKKPRKHDKQTRWELQLPPGYRGHVLRDKVCEICDGYGRYNPIRKCGHCRGAGWDPVTGEYCEVCNGIGWVVHAHKVRGVSPERVTARPTDSSVKQLEPDSYSLEPEEATSLGDLSRRLSALGQLDALARTALEAFWGPVGEHWRTECTEGRIFAVYMLTAPAKKLLRGKACREDMPAHMALGALAEVQNQQPNALRARLFEAAHRDAVALYRRAAELWGVVSVQEVRAKQRVPEPLESVKAEGICHA